MVLKILFPWQHFYSRLCVFLPPSVAPKVQLTPPGPLRVRMGDAVAVECRATGRPRPTLTWKRQGSTLQLLPREVNDANVLQVRERHRGTRRDEKPLRESINFLLVMR